MTIAEQIKQLRKSRKLTQKELARQSGVSFSFINELEGGKQSIRLDILSQLADLFGFEVSLVKKKSDQTSKGPKLGK